MRSFSMFNSHLSTQDCERARENEVRSLATWAYLLLRPGMEFVRQRSNFILGWQAAAASGATLSEGVSAGAVGRADVPPLGSWMILPTLTTAETRTVLPSNDALYGAAHVELDLLGPVVISVPQNIDQRFFSVAVMDAHMNNLGHIGPRTTGNDACDVVVVGPDFNGDTPKGMKVISSPTQSICIYNRMLVNTADELPEVQRWQSELKITQLSKWGSHDTVPDVVDVQEFVHPELNETTDAFDYLRIGLAHLKRNPLVQEASWLSSLIESAGLLDAISDTRLAAAVNEGVDQATFMLDETLTTWPRRNGWMVPDPDLGLPNPKVLISAAFQQFQIGSNDIEESAYFFTETDAANNRLDASNGAIYELRFNPDEIPQHLDQGYWSVTMYNEHSLLASNKLNRFALRPTSPGFTFNADGGVTIVLSHELPASVNEGNWLPAPDGAFLLGVRVYYPTEPITQNGWVPPAVTIMEE